MTSPNLVQETNIERILEDHLWDEVRLITDEIAKLQDTIEQLAQRKSKLMRIAEAADLPLTP